MRTSEDGDDDDDHSDDLAEDVDGEEDVGDQGEEEAACTVGECYCVANRPRRRRVVACRSAAASSQLVVASPQRGRGELAGHVVATDQGYCHEVADGLGSVSAMGLRLRRWSL